MFEFFVAIVSFFIGILVARWAFRINEMISLQKKQISLLTMIARQQGVPGEALDFVLADSIDSHAKKYLTGVDPNAKYNKNS